MRRRSAIAGGVAMSSNANLMCEPWLALVIGALGGMACCFGLHRARGCLESRLQVHDTVGVPIVPASRETPLSLPHVLRHLGDIIIISQVGVTSMHLWPGLIAWLFGVIAFLPLTNDDIKGDLQGKRLRYHLDLDQILNHNRGDGDAVLASVCV